MPNISLPTGKVIYLSTYEWLFQLEEKNVDEFFQNCIADDLGAFIEDPFSMKTPKGRLEVEETLEIPEVADEAVEEEYE